jgi:two-component system KDP operon response regulator KdpE
MDYKILIVEDEESFLRLIHFILKEAGYTTFTAANGLEGLRAFYDSHPDMIVMDLAMPVMDGVTLCRRIREVNEQLPIMMLTALGSEQDIVAGLDAGADEYMVKPLRQREFLARVASLLRRQRAWASSPLPAPVVCYADDYLSIDLASKQITIDNQPVKLTPTEYRLLAVLVQNAGKVLSNRQIVEQVWGPEYLNDNDYPRAYIRHLRRKIEPEPEAPRYLVNEPGVGYRFVEQRRLAPQPKAALSFAAA